MAGLKIRSDGAFTQWHSAKLEGSGNHSKMGHSEMGSGASDKMRGFLRVFLPRAERQAELIFLQLRHSHFEPELFFIAVHRDEGIRSSETFVEPSEDFWCRSADFDGVPSVVDQKLLNQQHIVAVINDTSNFYGPTGTAEEWVERQAIADSISSNTRNPGTHVYYVGMPVKTEEYKVYFALGLLKSKVDSFPSLPPMVIDPAPSLVFFLAESFVEAVAFESLSRLGEKMVADAPTFKLDAEEVIRASGFRFMDTIGCRTSGKYFASGWGLFKNISKVASLTYERASSEGTIALFGAGSQPPLDIRFGSPTSFSNTRAVRKLLELTRNGFILCANEDSILGLANPSQIADETVMLAIVAPHCWEVQLNSKIQMRVEHGVPGLPQSQIDKRKVRHDLSRIFHNSDANGLDRIVELVEEASTERHGTMIVVSEEAAAEALRLASQATKIEPVLLTPAVLKNLTAIDGAVLISPDSICHAFGVVLDGVATTYGDPGRGARFNSALRYYASSQSPCFIAVVSEDGSVDFVPNTRPPFNRRDVDAKVAELVSLASSRKCNSRLAWRLFYWFVANKFYLLQEDCNTINSCFSDIAKLEGGRVGRYWDINIDPDMDPEYYYV